MARKKIEPSAILASDNDNIYCQYIVKKKQFDKLKKELDDLSELVKEDMKNTEQSCVIYNGHKLTRTESTRISWDEDKLVEIVSTFDNPNLIYFKPTVNMVELERFIMDGNIHIDCLASCRKTTQVVQLRMTAPKVKED